MSLKRRFKEPGFVVSVLVHVGALAATLIAFSHNEKFDDLQETVPVEIVTDTQFNQIMKGDKSAKEVRPDAVAKTETVAQPDPQPTPPTPEKAQTEPPPPPPPPPPPSPPMPPVREVEEPPPPTPAPPTPPVPTPPERPEMPEPEATPPVPTPPVRDVEAEPVAPKVPPKPVLKPTPRPVPTPPVVPHPLVAKLPEPRPAPRPKPVEKPKVDLLAKLMQETPADTTPAPAPHPVPAKAKPSHPVSDTSKFDPNNISKLLANTSAPAQRSSAAHDTSRVASLGSPTANAPKMAPSMWAGLDGLMEDQYRQCWSYLGLNAGEKYIPQVRVTYGANGGLEGEPVLINPPSDPALQSLADSALRAVRRCNPLKIPDQYAPYYEQWRGRVLRFDPEEMAG